MQMSHVCTLEPSHSKTKTKSPPQSIRIAEVSAKQLKQVIKLLEKVSKGVWDKEPVIELSVFYRTLALTATNKQHSFSIHIDLDAECESECSFTVPTEVLVKVAKSLKNQDRLIIEKRDKKIDFVNGVNFSASVSKVTLLEVEEFKKNQHRASLIGRGWKKAFTTALIAATEMKSRYALDAIRIVSQEQEVKAIALDGHRMAIAHLQNIVEQDRRFEVSMQKSVAELLVPLLDDETEVSLNVGDQSIDLQFWNEEKDVWFCSESLLAPDNFPDWRSLIPHCHQRAVFPKREVEIALTKMTQLAQNLQYRSDWIFHPNGQLELKIRHEDDQQESHTVLQAQEGFLTGELHFNYRYVLDYLKVLEEEELVIQQSPRPCLLSGPSGNTQYILMPFIREAEETDAEASTPPTESDPQ